MADIHAARYFLNPAGAAAVATTVRDGEAGSFEAAIEFEGATLTGDANTVMDGLTALANHFADAREALLVHITEG
jgi:hypothetical protein